MIEVGQKVKAIKDVLIYEEDKNGVAYPVIGAAEGMVGSVVKVVNTSPFDFAVEFENSKTIVFISSLPNDMLGYKPYIEFITE